MKKTIARFILRSLLSRFHADPHPFNRLLGKAVELQLGKRSEDAFRIELDRFYQDLDLDAIKTDLDFEKKQSQLQKPNGYKVGVISLKNPSGESRKLGRFDFWGRRFGLLRHLGIDADVMILRRDHTIPPHGHHRIVSGFYVLKGRIAIRHYDRVEPRKDGIAIRKVLDCQLEERGFTTNSEFVNNIHWLQGLADESILFRINVKGTPTKTFGDADRIDSRIYIDPTLSPDEKGIIESPYISEAEAKKLKIIV